MILKFLRDEHGAAAGEYALGLALLGLGVAGAASSFSGALVGSVTHSASVIASAAAGAPSGAGAGSPGPAANPSDAAGESGATPPGAPGQDKGDNKPAQPHGAAGGGTAQSHGHGLNKRDR